MTTKLQTRPTSVVTRPTPVPMIFWTNGTTAKTVLMKFSRLRKPPTTRMMPRMRRSQSIILLALFWCSIMFCALTVPISTFEKDWPFLAI